MQNFPIIPGLLQEIDQLSNIQLAWLSGYTKTKSQNIQTTDLPAEDQTTESQTPGRKITVLSASQTGNARHVAEKLLAALKQANFPATLIATGDYKSKNISSEDIILLICSTQGEGDPPEEAIPLFKFLYGKEAPNVSKLSFAVLALGDSSYPDFCLAGKMFDEKLAELGAVRIAERIDCDVDFEKTANQWIQNIINILTDLIPQNTSSIISARIIEHTFPISEISPYTKENSYTATLLSRQKITSGNANKDVEHLEIDIAGSNLRYQAGDSLGVWFTNDPILVEDILKACHLAGDELIQLENNSQLTIRKALTELDEITQNSPQFVKGLAALSLQEELLHLANDPQQIQGIIHQVPILNLLQKYPAEIHAQALHNFLRPITPRFYSIASSQLAIPDEVHLTVSVVRFQYEGYLYTGGASGFLGERLKEGENLQVFIESNRRFKLPQNTDVPIIMIASGTGIAPFRAFMQERENTGAKGKNWLLFGNQNLVDDFLYQVEWQRWYQLGILNKCSLAWSRQFPDRKIYVQDKLLEEADAIWEWLQNGAHLYVCGNANKMAKDVENVLLKIIQIKGKLNEDAADEFLNNLRENERYQRDVY